MAIDLEEVFGPSAERWRTGIPTAQEAIGAVADPAGTGGRSAFAAVDMTKLATAYTWVSEARLTGASATSVAGLEAFGGLVTSLQNNPKGAAVWGQAAGPMMACLSNPGGCGDVLIDAMVEKLSVVVQSIATSTPVLGWIIGFTQLAIAVGSVIWSENQDAKPAPEMPLISDPQTDTNVGNDLLDLLRMDDWTELFMPYHDPREGGSIIRNVQVEFGTGYKGGRIMMTDPQGYVQGGGHGLMPGGSVARMWQYRGKQASTGSTKLDNLAKFLNLPIAAGEGYEDYTTYGQEFFVPAYLQMSQLAWSILTRPGPAMFRMDVSRARPAWEAYWESWLLGLYQITTGGDKKTAEVVLRVLNPGGSFPDWPAWQTLAGYASGPDAWDVVAAAKAAVPEEYRDLLKYNMHYTGDPKYLGEEYGGWFQEMWPELGDMGSPNTWWVTNRGRCRRYLDNLEDAQRATLHRLDVAYMTGREPGLGGQGSSLWDLWDQNRTKLLNHPAANSTSLDMSRVPVEDYTGTGEWRNALVEKRLSGAVVAPSMGPAPLVLNPTFPWGVGAPRTRIPEKDPPPPSVEQYLAQAAAVVKKQTFASPPPAPLTPADLEAEESASGGGGAIAVAAAAAAAITAIVVMRRKKRRR